MQPDASNRELIDAWRGGDNAAAELLVHRYMMRLTALARSRLSRKLSRRLDPEDVVMSAWRSFFTAASDERLLVPAGDDLWPLLVTMTLRKLARQAIRQNAQRRATSLEVSFVPDRDWRAVVCRDPDPAEAAQLVDELEAILADLDTNDREVLTRLLRGEDKAAIAAAIGLSERSIRRAMQRIREGIARREDEPVLRRGGAADRSIEPIRICADAARPEKEMSSPAGPKIVYTDIVLQKLIGQGGFGKVYRAVWRSTGTTVAVKYLKKRFWQDPRAIRSLISETQRVTALSHPNIIRHHGWGRTSRGAVFVVMEWIDGLNAGDWVRTANPGIRSILECGVALAHAVTAAHAAGIVHGDLTPANVLRSVTGKFVLTDFGFARSLNSAIGSLPGGTPGFLAPEQISEAFGIVGERTDVYGLGGFLYALATNCLPTTGVDVPEILAKVLSSAPVVPASHLIHGLPPALDCLLQHCLCKEPQNRPATAAEVATRLREILES